jgi:hypothetical protein
VEVNTGSGLVFTLLFGDKLRLHRSISTRLGRGTFKKENRLPWIEPGETKDMEVEIGVLEGMPEMQVWDQGEHFRPCGDPHPMGGKSRDKP